jgi:hypothetical protein
MSKVKIYDLGSFSAMGPDINAVIVGKERVILTDNEAIHSIHNIAGSIDFIKGVSVPVQTILDATPIKEEELGTFIRHFGSRIESNYQILLGSIKDIGLDPKDYPRDQKEGL